MAHKQLNTFHLFAGAGGGILADLLLDHNPIGACEIEPYPRNVLLTRQRDGILPAFPIWDDVCTLDGKPWRGSVDVLCGGFPCQDISSAGKGAGITGARSGLWKEYARLIDEMRPRFVFAENSPLLRTRGLGVVFENLAALGYDARWGIMGAWHVGAPHKRDRMWVLAYAKGQGMEGLGRSREVGGFDRQRTRSDFREDGGEAGAMWWHTDPADLADTNSKPIEQKIKGREESIAKDWSNLRDQLAAKSGDNTSTTEPLVGRVANGVANRVDRLKAIGNGQTPQCAAMAFNILSEGLI